MRLTAESTSDSVTECGFVVGEVASVLPEVPRSKWTARRDPRAARWQGKRLTRPASREKRRKVVLIRPVPYNTGVWPLGADVGATPRHGPKEDSDMDLGLLLLRLVLAAILYMHSTQKLLGWFSGPGLDRAEKLFENLGQRPGRQMVKVAAACEAVGALLIAIGLATPLGAAMLAGTMLVAGGSLTMTKGTVWNALGGGEYPLVLAAFALVLGFTGPGGWSLDSAISAPWVPKSNARGLEIGIIVLVVAGLAAGAALLRTRSNLSAVAAAESAPPTSASA